MEDMNKSPQQLIKLYAACPISQKEYEIDGKKYMVTRRFTGDKDINKLITELAVSRANRESGF